MLQGPRPTRWPTLLARFTGACALACLVGIVFFPIGGFEFIESDVVAQVVYNPYIRGLSWDNVKHVLSSPCITSFYPVRTLTYAVDYQIWGLNAGGFKLTGGLIHLANVLLVFWLVLRLLRPGAAASRSAEAWRDVVVAAFSAAVFAVHPVVVEPVVWVSGREELLMTLGALGCLHFHLSARRLSQDGGKTRRAAACHVAAAFSCAAACLSNAVAAVIPLLIVAWDLLTLARPRLRKIVYGTAPLWAIAVLAILIKGPGSEAALAREAGTLSAERLMLVLNAYWLNLKTLAWPTGLALSYERLVPKSFLDPQVILGGIGVCLTWVVLWGLRRRKVVLFGVLWFGLALGPTAQIMPHHVHRADRFLYLPLVGLAVALGAGLSLLGTARRTTSAPTPTRRRAAAKGVAASAEAVSSSVFKDALKSRLAVAGAIAMGFAGLVLLGIASTRQVQYWRDSVSLWEHGVRAAPNNPVSHRALADGLARQGQLDQAFPHYRKALELEPDYVDALANFAFYLVTCTDQKLRDDALAVELAQRGCRLTGWKDPGLRRTLAAAWTRRANTLARGRRFRPAIECYDKALEADADYEMALLDLAFLLTTCAEEELRDAKRAVRLAERACELADPPDPARLGILAAAYAEAGRFEQAVATAEEALGLAEAAGNRRLTEELTRQLKLYQDQKPYRDPP